MSYQIKSTPFFRRMLSTSKKNGQLQKLKDEYERIQEFNDRTIEMKMRQVRLKRLFREIEEIKDSSLQWKRRRMSSEKIKTTEELRLENLHKAKELGKEYSKLNGLIAERSAVPRAESASGLLPINSSYAKIEGEKKARSAKRIKYGNDISRSNIRKISSLPARKPTMPKISESKAAMAHRKEQLKQRLTYGNSCSSLNMSKIPKKSMRHKIATEIEDESCSTPTFAVTPPPATVTICDSIITHKMPNNENIDTEDNDSDAYYFKDTTRAFKTFEDLQNSKTQINTRIQLNNVDTIAQLRARKYWRKLALTVCNRFDTRRRRRRQLRTLFLNQTHMLQPSSKATNTDFADEFKLRQISNDRNLPTMSSINVNLDMMQHDIEYEGREEEGYGNEDEEEVEGEVLLNINSLDRAMSPQMIIVENAATNTMTMTLTTTTGTTNIAAAFNTSAENDTTPDSLPNSDSVPLADISKKVQSYVKMFEPYVREAAEKEAYEYGVNKLRSIFEHQGE